ncbi:unnamed protein product, partial [Heterosigma akashiwo]
RAPHGLPAAHHRAAHRGRLAGPEGLLPRRGRRHLHGHRPDGRRRGGVRQRPR